MQKHKVVHCSDRLAFIDEFTFKADAVAYYKACEKSESVNVAVLYLDGRQTERFVR